MGETVRGFGRLALSVGYVTLLLFLTSSEMAGAQGRSSAEGIEIHDYSWPFPERIIKHSKSKAPVAARALDTTNGLDTFQRVPYHTTGQKKFLVVLADVVVVNNDGSTRTFPSPLRNAAQAREFLESSNNNIKDSVETASWGQFSISSDLIGDEENDIFGPITLTIRSNQASDTKGSAPELAGGDQSTEGDLCDSLPSKYTYDYTALGLSPDNVSDFDATLTLVSTSAVRYSNCPWYAVTDKSEDAVVASVEDLSASDQAKQANALAITHEIGHLLGLDHSHGHALEYIGPDSERAAAAKEYGDLTSLMGFGAYFGTLYLNVPQSFRVGWLPKSSAIEITEPGSYTVTLDSPAKGPQAPLPTSLWIERKSFPSCNTPGFVVVSSGTGGEMMKHLKAVQNVMDGPISRVPTVIDYGLTVHSVPLAGDGFDYGDNFGRSDDGGSYLEGIVEHNQSLKVPNLGVTVTLVKRDGDHSIVQVDVANMHRLFTRKVEKRVPGTRHSLKVIAHMEDAEGLSAYTLSQIRKLSRLYHRSEAMLSSEEDLAPKCYSAGVKVTAVVERIERAARRALLANGQQRTNIVHLNLKPLARRYLAG